MFLLPQNSENVPPWTRIFIEVALRALLRIHHDFLLYSVSQDPKKQPDFRALNSGPGVAYADELTVCAAIAQEFLATRYVSGVWLDGSPSGLIQPGQRYFKIEREAKYPNNNDRADFRVERIDNETDSIIGVPTLIEAKRAFRWSTKLHEVKPKPAEDLLPELISDIRKLREAAGSELKALKRLRGYTLVWNVQEKGGYTDEHAKHYFDRTDLSGVLWQVRMSPLSFSAQILDCLEVDASQLISWLWVALAEVTDLADEDLHP